MVDQKAELSAYQRVEWWVDEMAALMGHERVDQLVEYWVY